MLRIAATNLLVLLILSSHKMPLLDVGILQSVSLLATLAHVNNIALRIRKEVAITSIF